MKKRILASLLSLVLLVGLMPTAAFAADAPKVSGNWADEDNYDVSWYNTEGTEFTLMDAADLAGLAKLVNENTETFSGKKVTLGANIDLAGKTWTTIGGSTYTFGGEFDGGNYTVSNIVDMTNAKYKGLFARARVCYIHDLKIDGVYFSCSEAVSAVQIGTLSGGATNYSVLKNIEVKNVTIDYANATNSYFGGLIGEALMYSQAQDIKVSDVSITVNGSGNEIAGINPKTQGNATTTGNNFPNQTNWITGATFTSSADNNSTTRILNGYYKNVDVDGLTVNATGSARIGGLSSFTAAGNAGWSSFYHDCDVTGLNVTCDGESKFTVGGLVGTAAGGDSAGESGSGDLSVNGFQNCTVSGTITASSATENSIFGGLFATKTDMGFTATDCKTDVTINGGAGAAGGFIGQVESATLDRILKIVNCEWKGSITTTGNAGGYVGELIEKENTPIEFTVTNCKSTGNVTGGTYAAGYVGYYVVQELADGEENNFSISKSSTYSGTLSASVTDDFINVPYQYYKAVTDDVYTVGASQAYVTISSIKVGYETLADAVAAGYDNVTLLQNATDAAITANQTSSNAFTLCLDDNDENGSKISSATLTGTVTVPDGVILTIKGSSKDNSIVLAAPEKTGYVFDGWYTNAEGTGTKLNNNTVTTVTAAGTSYYPKWIQNEFTISYELNGGTLAENAPATYTKGTSAALPEPTKTGYTFNGWTGDDLTEATKNVTIGTDATGNKSYTANWTANTYTVSFNANTGNGTMESQTATYDQALTLTNNAFTAPSGKNFSGWATTAGGTVAYADGASVLNLTTEPNGTVTLYAVWADKATVAGPTGSLVTQENTYTGTAQSFALGEGNTGFDITYKQNGQEETPINAGIYDVVITKNGGNTHADYTTTITSGLVIKKAGLTAAYAGETIKFGETPALDVTISGFVNDETEDVLTTKPTVTCNDTAVGTYSLAPAGGEADNYEFTYAAGTLKIEKADSQVTPGTDSADISATYGETITLTATVERNPSLYDLAQDDVAFYCGETELGVVDVSYNADGVGTAILSYNTANGGIPVGSQQTITASYGGSVSLNGSNSDIIEVTLAKKELTITGLTATDRAYDGTTTVALTGGTLVGKVGSDDVTAAMPTTGTMADAAPGTDKAVTVDVSGITLSGAQADRYTLTAPTDVTVNITGSASSDTPSRPSRPSGTTSTTYAITAAKTENGTVTLSPKSASKGTTVTITVTPDEGYELDTLVVLDKNGDEIELKEKGDNKFTFKMPAGKVTVEAEFALVEVEPTWDNPFIDVDEDDWFYTPVSYVEENGLMSGMTADSFGPNAYLTRAMLAQVLYNLDEDAKPGAAAFTDVKDEWFADAVNWAYEMKVVSGLGNGQFGPNNNITREQLATILYNYANQKGYIVTGGKDIDSFPDAGETSAWAVGTMEWAVGNGLISGRTNGDLDPQGFAKRAEIASVLMNFCEKIIK